MSKRSKLISSNSFSSRNSNKSSNSNNAFSNKELILLSSSSQALRFIKTNPLCNQVFLQIHNTILFNLTNKSMCLNSRKVTKECSKHLSFKICLLTLKPLNQCHQILSLMYFLHLFLWNLITPSSYHVSNLDNLILLRISNNFLKCNYNRWAISSRCLNP